MIQRKLYLNKIQQSINKDVIKVITDIRRSGESVFLRQVMEMISSQNKIYLNFEDL